MNYLTGVVMIPEKSQACLHVGVLIENDRKLNVAVPTCHTGSSISVGSYYNGSEVSSEESKVSLWLSLTGAFL